MKKWLSNPWWVVSWLGLGHGINDCIAGYIAGTIFMIDSEWSPGTLILIYNVIAFGGQLPAGIIADKIKSSRGISLVCILLAMNALVIFRLSPFAGILSTALASAFYHVAGGRVALLTGGSSALAPGIFAGPGVAGLALGGIFATVSWDPSLLILLLATIVFSVLFLSFFPDERTVVEKTEHHSGIDRHDLIMVLLLFAIAFRSMVWNLVNTIHTGDVQLLAAICLVAGASKILGGWVSNFTGSARWSIIGMLVAIPFLLMGDRSSVFLLTGVAFLQSVTPAAIKFLHMSFPGKPGTVSGLAFGLAIAAGGIPFQKSLELIPDPPGKEFFLYPGIPALILFAFAYFFFRRKKSVA